MSKDTVDSPTHGKPGPAERGLLDMEDPLVDLERLIGGIMGLGFDLEDLRACYILALRASERLTQLRDLWENRLNLERGQAAV
jgi:hypothetical protein